MRYIYDLSLGKQEVVLNKTQALQLLLSYQVITRIQLFFLDQSGQYDRVIAKFIPNRQITRDEQEYQRLCARDSLALLTDVHA